MVENAKAADGLLGTTLRWEDVEEIANEGTDVDVKIGERSVKPLAEGVVSPKHETFRTTAFQGLQSLLGVAEVNWKTQGKSPYPHKFALKIGSPVALLRGFSLTEIKK